MDRVERERRMLQRVVALAGIVPVAAGSYGAVFGAALTGDTGMSVAGDSHYRYLSGLLLGIGLLFWSAIPGIERNTGRFQLLTLIVVVGGLARLGGLLITGLPALTMVAALVMELVVTPLICLWQLRVSRQNPILTPAQPMEARTP
jgi:hypothetical protein